MVAHLADCDACRAEVAAVRDTLAADTRKGMRPSFTPAASPDLGLRLFEAVVSAAAQAHGDVQTGRFGARMRVALVNDGPVTFWLQA